MRSYGEQRRSASLPRVLQRTIQAFPRRNQHAAARMFERLGSGDLRGVAHIQYAPQSAALFVWLNSWIHSNEAAPSAAVCSAWKPSPLARVSAIEYASSNF
jgi:hypothetical protein